MGDELIRVDRNEFNQCMIIEDDELQNKGDRYYFKETLEVEAGEVYISPMDLNIEHGKLEIPLKPMLRIGKPILSRNGDIIGAIIINIKGQKLLDVISNYKTHDNDSISLINSDGYYLSGGNELDFNFMYPDKEDLGFFSEHNSVWNEIELGNSKYSDNSDWFYMQKMNPVNNRGDLNNEVEWYLVMQMYEEDIAESYEILYNTIKFVILVVGPLLILFSYLLGITQAKNYSYKEDLLKRSTYDTLTGLYNRRIIMEMLHQMVELSRRNKKPLSILYIDVNNLKFVNDTIGHNMGDEMIIAAADSIKGAVRRSDLVARIGGDEYLVVLPNCKEEDATVITMKMAKAFGEKGIEYMNELWGMSYGCAVLRENESETKFIQRADHYMYENKRSKRIID